MTREERLKAELAARSRELGFHSMGVATAGPLEAERGRLWDWLERGRHGSMGYIARLAAERLDPHALLPGARSVICLAHTYHAGDEVERDVAATADVRVARYARGRDYHRVLRRKLRELARLIERELPDARARIAVDTAPLLEKAWAERAGIGWRGKHTNLVLRSGGSWMFLGEILTTVALPADRPHLDFCGTCTRCLDACPTGAFPEPYVMDARRCISYLTIEYRGAFTGQQGEMIDDHLFGCDICLDVCPWNRFRVETPEPDFRPRPAITERTAREWVIIDDTRGKELLRGSALGRAGIAGLRRNATWILRNRGRSPESQAGSSGEPRGP